MIICETIPYPVFLCNFHVRDINWYGMPTPKTIPGIYINYAIYAYRKVLLNGKDVTCLLFSLIDWNPFQP